MSREWELYFDDILSATDKILKYVNGLDRSKFEADDKTFDAVVRNLEIIGEAAKRLPEEIQLLMPDIEWRKICGLRDILAHAYFGIDIDILWDIISHKIPELKEVLVKFQKTRNI